jgi:glycosyltransferase involved in cell wall biosynthesis
MKIADDERSGYELIRSKTSIVAFGTDDWDNNPQTRHHVLSHLASRGWRITYTNGPHFVWGIRQPKWVKATWTSRLGTSDGVNLSWPARWLARWPRFRAWDRLIVNRYVRLIIHQSRWKDAHYRIAYVFHPQFQCYVDKLGDCHVVYHADDSFSKMPEWTNECALAERNLVSMASLVIASSPGIRRNLPRSLVSVVRVLQNGANVKLFMAAETPVPADLDSIPRPRIGYFGSINPKVDLRLVERLATLEPRWQWVFVGDCIEKQIFADPPSKQAWLKLRCRANVHFFGARLYSDIPRYQTHMDVNALCYRTDTGGWWTDLSPLKLHEYLAVGKPVVASPLEVLNGLEHVVAIASGENEWLNALGDAINGKGSGTFTQRRAIALANDWGGIVDQLESWLTSMVTAAR